MTLVYFINWPAHKIYAYFEKVDKDAEKDLMFSLSSFMDKVKRYFIWKVQYITNKLNNSKKTLKTCRSRSFSNINLVNAFYGKEINRLTQQEPKYIPGGSDYSYSRFKRFWYILWWPRFWLSRGFFKIFSFSTLLFQKENVTVEPRL